MRPKSLWYCMTMLTTGLPFMSAASFAAAVAPLAQEGRSALPRLQIALAAASDNRVMMLASAPSVPASAPEPEPVPAPDEAAPSPAPLSKAGGPKIDFTGYIEAEGRWFLQASHDGVDHRVYGSLAAEPSLGIEWADGRQKIKVTGFGRIDTVTDARTHLDLREAKWVGVFGPLEATIGVDRKFWGVTEAAHLVNVINQVDALEDIRAEQFLGQPLASLALTTNQAGTFSVYLLPYFRERRFPGRQDRPNAPLLVDRRLVQYESANEEWHVDWAARWSLKAGPLDFGLSHFSGTNREPRIGLTLNGQGRPVLFPQYDLIDQTSIDLQATFGAWLLKFEGYYQWSRVRDYGAFAAGFEYTFYGVTKSGADLGLVAEYLYDGRGKPFFSLEQGITPRAGASPFDNDLFVGLRWAGNDVATTEVLAGAAFDLDTSSKSFRVEASRRFGDSWRISLDVRLFTSVAPRDPLVILGDDDFVQLKLQWYF